MPGLCREWSESGGGCDVLDSSVAGHREGVDHQRPAEHLDLLTAPSEAVSAPEEQGVLESAVERLGIVPAAVEAREVGIRGRDRALQPIVSGAHRGQSNFIVYLIG